MLTVLKLGGSVITEKDRAETLDGPALDRAAEAVAAARDDRDSGLVLVHGGGSFGHHNAERHGVSTTAGTRDVDAIMDVHGAMHTLNSFVLRALQERDVPAVPVHPFSAAVRDEDGELTLCTDQVAGMVAEGFVPVLHGDGVVHAGEGVTVLSGDELVAALATGLDAERVGVCSTEDGVYGADGDVLDEITAFADVADALGDSAATDVSGGMAGKVRALLALPVPASVFGLDDLATFLEGGSPGTTIRGD